MVAVLWETMETQAREHPEVALVHERLAANVRLIGLTGGIGSGKSTVSGMIRQLGIPVIDADQIARDVVRPGEPAHAKIVARFGEEILNADGTLNREKLGGIVFADEALRRALEAITHPPIFQAIAEEVRRLSRERKAKTVVVDAALLFESGLADSMDANVVVAVPDEIQCRRLKERDGLSEAEARQKIAAQMPTEEKIRRADRVIDNSGSLDQTQTAVTELFSFNL